MPLLWRARDRHRDLHARLAADTEAPACVRHRAGSAVRRRQGMGSSKERCQTLSAIELRVRIHTGGCMDCSVKQYDALNDDRACCAGRGIGSGRQGPPDNCMRFGGPLCARIRWCAERVYSGHVVGYDADLVANDTRNGRRNGIERDGASALAAIDVVLMQIAAPLERRLEQP